MASKKFSVLRFAKIHYTDGRIENVYHKDFEYGVMHSFQKSNALIFGDDWRIGVDCRTVDTMRQDQKDDAESLAYTCYKDDLGEVESIYIKDEYIPLKKNGDLDHDGLFSDCFVYSVKRDTVRLIDAYRLEDNFQHKCGLVQYTKNQQ